MTEQETISETTQAEPAKPKRQSRKKSAPKEVEERTDLRVEFISQHPVYHSKYWKKGDIVELENEAEFDRKHMMWIVQDAERVERVNNFKPLTWRWAMGKLPRTPNSQH